MAASSGKYSCDTGTEYGKYSLEERLIIHATDGAWEAVRGLVRNGADISYKNNNGESALHIALLDRDVPLEVIRLLIHPAIINSFTRNGLTPLHIAARSHRPRIIRELLWANADPSIRSRDRRGSSPMEFFLRMNLRLDVSFLEELVPAGYTIDMLELLVNICHRYLGPRLDKRDKKNLQRVLRFFLPHVHLRYPLQVHVQQVAGLYGRGFAVTNELLGRNQIRNVVGPSLWLVGMLASVGERKWHWIVKCLISCGYTIIFPPANTQPNSNPQSQQQQQEHEVIRNIKATYALYKHQEEKEVARLSDLCCSVVLAHVQRPIKADKLRKCNLPDKILRLLTREDMVDQVYEAVLKY